MMRQRHVPSQEIEVSLEFLAGRDPQLAASEYGAFSGEVPDQEGILVGVLQVEQEGAS